MKVFSEVFKARLQKLHNAGKQKENTIDYQAIKILLENSNLDIKFEKISRDSRFLNLFVEKSKFELVKNINFNSDSYISAARLQLLMIVVFSLDNYERDIKVPILML